MAHDSGEEIQDIVQQGKLEIKLDLVRYAFLGCIAWIPYLQCDTLKLFYQVLV